MPEADYSAAVLDHFRNPRNAGRLPRDTPGVATGEAGDSTERVRLWLRIDDDGRIRELRFQAFGCPGTIACASYATVRLAGRRLASARLDASEIASALDLAPARARLAELPVAALAAARANHERSAPSA